MSELMDRIQAAEAEVAPKLNAAAYDALQDFADTMQDHLEHLIEVLDRTPRPEAARWDLGIVLMESFGQLALAHADELAAHLQAVAADLVGATPEEVRAEIFGA